MSHNFTRWQIQGEKKEEFHCRSPTSTHYWIGACNREGHSYYNPKHSLFILLFDELKATKSISKEYHSRTHNYCMLVYAIAIWGCMPEITKDCIDMTNASSTYLSIALGAVVGALISWLIFTLQKKSSIKQEQNLKRLNDLNESHDRILKLIQQFQKHQEHLLD